GQRPEVLRSEDRVARSVAAAAEPGVTLVNDDRRLSRVLLAPALIYIAALVGAPFVLALIYSLTSISLGGHSFNFVGLQNFQAALRDSSFRRALGNTVLFAFVSQIVVLVLA